VRIPREVLQALALLRVARVADEAVGLARAAGPTKSGATSIERQSDTQATALDAGHRLRDVDHRSFARGAPLGHVCLVGQQPRRDALDLFQWTASMSTIISFSTGMLPIGSISMTPSLRGLQRGVEMVCSQPGLPLTRTPHDPQIAPRTSSGCRSSRRSAPWALQQPFQTERCGSKLDGVLIPVRRLARLRVVAAYAEVKSCEGLRYP